AEEGLRARRGHAALERVLGSIVVAEGDLGRRITQRVKELVDSAERETERDSDTQARRLIDEIERLDAAAAKAARDKVAETARRRDANRAQTEEAKRQKERDEAERRAAEGRAEPYVALARQRLESARAAAGQGQLKEARRLGEDCAALLRTAFGAY